MISLGNISSGCYPTNAPIVAFSDKPLENAIDNQTEISLRFQQKGGETNASLLCQMSHQERDEGPEINNHEEW